MRINLGSPYTAALLGHPVRSIARNSPVRHSLFELLSHLAVGSLAHAAVYRRLQDRTLVLNSRAFKDVIAVNRQLTVAPSSPAALRGAAPVPLQRHDLLDGQLAASSRCCCNTSSGEWISLLSRVR